MQYGKGRASARPFRLRGAAVVKGRGLWAVVAVCLLSGNGWLLRQAWPSEIGWPFAACVHYALIGLVGLVFVAAGGLWKEVSSARMMALGGAGLCLFLVPTFALELASGKVPESLIAAVFCSVPLMTVLAAAAFGSAASQVRGLMVPALIGLAGAALLFPLIDPGSLRRWLFLGLVVGAGVVVAAASVWIHRLAQGVGVAAAVSAVGLGCAVVLGIYGLAVGWPAMGAGLIAGEMLRCALLDLPEVWLLVWLMREVEPARLSARFLLVSLVTVCEGYAITPGAIGWRNVLAAGLLCAGGVMLLLRDEPEEAPGLGLA